MEQPLDLSVLRTVPKEHQAAVLRLCVWEEYYSWWWEMGLGKSKVLLDNAYYLKEAGLIDSLLVLAPSGSYASFAKFEVPKHYSGLYRCGTYYASKGARHKKALEPLMRGEFQGEKLDILFINTEACSVKKGLATGQFFINNHKSTMIAIDEATDIKNSASQRTKAITLLGRKCKYRRTLTGTPAPRDILDLYSQLEFLKPGLSGFRNLFQFKHYHAVMKEIWIGKNKKRAVVDFFQNESKLMKRIEPFTSRLTKQECLNLPPKLYIERECELTDIQKKHYNDLCDTMVAMHEDKIMTVEVAIAGTMRLRQITHGYFKPDEEELIHLENNRLPLLMAILEELGDEQVIIWGAFRLDLVMISEALTKAKKTFVEYSSNTPKDQRPELAEEFRSGKAQYFLSTPKTGGLGLTFVNTKYVVYYGNGNDLLYRLQSEDRNHRIGQDEDCTYIDIVVPDSEDSRTLHCLRTKRNRQESLLDNWREAFTKVN